MSRHREPDEMSPRYRTFRAFMVLMGKIFMGFTVHGVENTPPSGSLVIAANHARVLDPVFVCMAVPRRIQWMAKKELFIFPFQKFFALIGAFPVDRQGGGRAALRAAFSFLGEGWALGIFPEGTRRKPGTESEAKSGAAMLAVRADSRVLPVYIDRVPGLVGRLRGEKCHAYIGEPMKLNSKRQCGKAYREISEDVLREIYVLPSRYKDE